MYFENPDVKDPNAEVTYPQARAIANACGGITQICPNYEEGTRTDVALTEMGLNRGKASKVIDALKNADLLGWNFGPDKADKARKATAILNRLGGISCRMPAAAPAPRSTGRAAASSSRGGARMSPEGFPELDITALMLGRGMSRAEAVRFLQLMGGR